MESGWHCYVRVPKYSCAQELQGFFLGCPGDPQSWSRLGSEPNRSSR